MVWDRAKIGQPGTITAIVAELAAVLGKEFVERSAVVLPIGT